MKIDWKAALVTIAIAYIGIKLVDRFGIPCSPPASAPGWSNSLLNRNPPKLHTMVIQNELPAFDTAAAGATARVRPDINLRRLHGIILQVQGIGPGGAMLDARNGIEYLQLLQDGKQKMLITPASWLEYQYRIDSNSDNLPVDFLHIPLSRTGLIWPSPARRSTRSTTACATISSRSPPSRTVTLGRRRRSWRWDSARTSCATCGAANTSRGC